MRIGLFVRGVAICLAIALGVVFSSSGADARPGQYTGVDGGRYAAKWTSAVDGPQRYNGVAPDLAVPITMDDGTVLKADVIHPARDGRRATGKRPVILQLQGYGKLPMLVGAAFLASAKGLGVKKPLEDWISSLNLPGVGLDGVFDLTRQLNSGAIEAAVQDWALTGAGYTLVQVDMRGTGNSNGNWQVFGEREKRDAAAVVNWIARQSWSDGNVGAMGVSFTAISALETTHLMPPALKSIFAYVPSADVFADIAGAGGAVGVGFLVPWLIGVNLYKMTPDVTSIIVGKFSPEQQLQWFKDRLADPATLLDVVASGYTALSPEQLTRKARELYDPNSYLRKGLKTDTSRIRVPTFIAGAWFDLFGNTATNTFNSIPLSTDKKKLIMGDGYHVGAGYAGFGQRNMPPRLDVLQRAWFDHWLRGIDNGIDKYSPITVKEQGGAWVSLPEFPVSQNLHRRMYLNAKRSGTSPTARFDGGLSAVSYPTKPRDLTVAPGLLSVCSRDSAQISAGIISIIEACARDSRIWEREGLTFTSSPMRNETTISGPINAHLNVVHDAKDGYWVATLNDVSPDGNSREISTGQLIASMRQIDSGRSQKSSNGDYTQPSYYMDLSKRQKTIPGRPVVLDISLTPIQATLKPGHRLRLDVYASNFPKGLPPAFFLADSGLKPQRVRLDAQQPSWVNVPLSAPIPS
ncbi:CocE/NonD family hydrolase [Gordonia sp. CPCC 205333]|uniref:CocE/NonD family hydrolase n=1 Tax=Gordonia sp. CPCC 205333 TaxID=3140790 RepID=UPI003AF3BAE3